MLILASTSPYRRQLLARTRLPFECVASGVAETPRPAEAGARLAARLAREKAKAVAAQHPDAWVIGSDQVAVMLDATGQERLLGKPGSAAQCADQLFACSGRTLAFVTGVAVVRSRDGGLSEFVDTTEVRFRVLDRVTIDAYVAGEPATDCAGGFKIEGLGITLCDAVHTSDPTALIGLPLIRLCAVLRSLGYDLP